MKFNEGICKRCNSYDTLDRNICYPCFVELGEEE